MYHVECFWPQPILSLIGLERMIEVPSLLLVLLDSITSVILVIVVLLLIIVGTLSETNVDGGCLRAVVSTISQDVKDLRHHCPLRGSRTSTNPPFSSNNCSIQIPLPEPQSRTAG